MIKIIFKIKKPHPCIELISSAGTLVSPGNFLKHDFMTALRYHTKSDQMEMLNLILFIAIVK